MIVTTKHVDLVTLSVRDLWRLLKGEPIQAGTVEVCFDKAWDTLTIAEKEECVAVIEKLVEEEE